MNNICNEYCYNNSDVIGKGSYSIVYKGINSKTNENVAIKKIVSNKNDKYIFNEIHILNQFKNTDNIINLHNYYNIDNIIYLVFNCCSISLDKFIKQNICIKEDLAQNYFSQIVNGLKTLYNNNIYHRDIKPQNILIENNIIYLCDFGLSKFISNCDDNIIKQSIVGSPLFMSPEIYNNLEYDLKSDLWSLGLVLFEMLSGYNYLYSNNITELISKIKDKDVPNINNISFECSNLLLKLLTKNIDERIEWKDLFKHKWLIPNDKIYKLNNDKISIDKVKNSSFSSDISSDEFLILSTEQEFDKTYSINNSFSFNDIFELFS